jgi:hypothetical protein
MIAFDEVLYLLLSACVRVHALVRKQQKKETLTSLTLLRGTKIVKMYSEIADVPVTCV